MKGTRYTTREAVLERAQEIIGIPLRDIDATGRLATGKGAIGTVVEESWFGYTPNSEAEPDLPEAGVELKVTPYLRGKNGVRAKERLVCNIINYMEEYDRTFETSAFWHKCNTMLLMSYEHLPGKPKGEYKIDAATLFRFPEEDLAIIEHDWETIMEKVRRGRAHEISEGDTLYLAACTKGASASSMREQPFSAIPAKQRAYSLKASYMTQILKRYIFGSEEDEHIIKSSRVLRQQSFEEVITHTLEPYHGHTQRELAERCGVPLRAKNANELILARLLGVKGRIGQTDEFKKAGICPKTVRVLRSGKVEQSMSFPRFDFIALSQEGSWESSELYDSLAPTRFMFVIFQQRGDGGYVFDRIKFWNMPEADLEEVGRVWERTVRTIRRGVRLVRTPGGMSNDLPKESESPVAHVRPHGRNSKDKAPLPDGRWMTKQCFWLNKAYIEKQISR